METKARRITPTVVRRPVTRTLQKKKRRSESICIPRSKHQWGMEQARQWALRKEPTPRESRTKAEEAEELNARMARIAKAKEASDAWKTALETLVHSMPRAQAEYKTELRCRGASDADATWCVVPALLRNEHLQIGTFTEPLAIIKHTIRETIKHEAGQRTTEIWN
jgi:hypothetical protein